jgi:putative endonuclease
MNRCERGRIANARGLAAEEAACAALARDGWCILARRLRTKAGEVDVLAQKNGLLAVVEVKARSRLAAAAIALTPRQQMRLAAAAELILGEHPDWAPQGVRFDLLVVDASGRVRRIADAFRSET